MKVVGELGHIALDNTDGFKPGQIVEYTVYRNEQLVQKVLLKCTVIGQKQDTDRGYKLWLSKDHSVITVDSRTALYYKSEPTDNVRFELVLM